MSDLYQQPWIQLVAVSGRSDISRVTQLWLWRLSYRYLIQDGLFSLCCNARSFACSRARMESTCHLSSWSDYCSWEWLRFYRDCNMITCLMTSPTSFEYIVLITFWLYKFMAKALISRSAGGQWESRSSPFRGPVDMEIEWEISAWHSTCTIEASLWWLTLLSSDQSMSNASHYRLARIVWVRLSSEVTHLIVKSTAPRIPSNVL